MASRHWFADGTFRVTPAGFDQLYTIHALRDGQSFPCVYALLPGRSQEVYRRLLTHVSTLAQGQQVITPPASVTVDFELAAMNAFLAHYPGMVSQSTL